ncbi:MAG TPA: hypothetical protein VFZ77_06120, partial [Acidimicrobiales bacterium]
PVGDLPTGARSRLHALLGPGGAAALGAAIRAAACTSAAVDGAGAGHPPLPPLTGDVGASPAGVAAPPQPGNDGDRAAGVAPALQRAALAHTVACEPGVPRLVRVVALLEAADALERVGHRLDVRSMALHDARVGAGLLVDLLADGLLVVPSVRVAGALAAVVRGAVGLLAGQPLVASRLAALADELERGRHVDGPRSARSPAAEAPSSGGGSPRAGAGPHVRVAVASLPGTVAEAAVTARRTGADHVQVRAAGWVERRHGLWARAFDVADGTLLGVAPLRRDGRDAVASLLVPASAMGRVEVDVTDRPEMPRPSAALAAVGRAIHLGAVAARAERVGDRRTAVRRWRQCARAWRSAGDQARCAQALAHARQAGIPGRPGPPAPSLLSDLIPRDG